VLLLDQQHFRLAIAIGVDQEGVALAFALAQAIGLLIILHGLPLLREEAGRRCAPAGHTVRLSATETGAVALFGCVQRSLSSSASMAAASLQQRGVRAGVALLEFFARRGHTGRLQSADSGNRNRLPWSCPSPNAPSGCSRRCAPDQRWA
jgi:hypothetical protein